MKTDHDDQYNVSPSNGPVITIAILWFLTCGAFIIWLFGKIFEVE